MTLVSNNDYQIRAKFNGLHSRSHEANKSPLLCKQSFAYHFLPWWSGEKALILSYLPFQGASNDMLDDIRRSNWNLWREGQHFTWVRLVIYQSIRLVDAHTLARILCPYFNLINFFKSFCWQQMSSDDHTWHQWLNIEPGSSSCASVIIPAPPGLFQYPPPPGGGGVGSAPPPANWTTNGRIELREAVFQSFPWDLSIVYLKFQDLP